jgi:dipeptidyl aminopeptidase/acylaminoacyl peptidase
VFPETWLPDGSGLLVTDSASDIGSHLVPANGGAPTKLLHAPADEWGATVSPDGRFVAYVSTETGVDEIFVETFPPGGGKWQVSVAGGQFPVWSRDGRRLAYVRGDEMMAVDVETRPAFRAGPPRALFRGPYQLRTAPIRNFDLGPDGRFVFARRWTDDPAPSEIEVRIGGTAP